MWCNCARLTARRERRRQRCGCASLGEHLGQKALTLGDSLDLDEECLELVRERVDVRLSRQGYTRVGQIAAAGGPCTEARTKPRPKRPGHEAEAACCAKQQQIVIAQRAKYNVWQEHFENPAVEVTVSRLALAKLSDFHYVPAA